MKQILIFLLFASLLCWFMFSPIYKHVMIVRQAVLQKEVDYLLETGASGLYGYIDSVMIEESKQRLADRGFLKDALIYSVVSSSGAPAANPASPLMRGTGLRLRIEYPYFQLFEIDRLIGIVPPDPGDLMGAQGMKMSEYVP